MHYSVAVLTNEEQTIDELLKPYDENKKVEPYVVKLKDDYLREIEEYCAKNIKYKKKINGYSDEQKIKDWTGYYQFDVNGNPLTTYNPNSKWDYYDIGGRWDKMLLTKKGEKVNSCIIEELLDLNSIKTYAAITPDGEWHESDGYHDEQWTYKERYLILANRNLKITIVDCHI